MDPGVTFVAISGFMVLIGGGAALSMLLPRLTRPSPRCTRRINMTAGGCRHCGQRFGPGASDRYVR